MGFRYSWDSAWGLGIAGTFQGVHVKLGLCMGFRYCIAGTLHGVQVLYSWDSAWGSRIAGTLHRA